MATKRLALWTLVFTVALCGQAALAYDYPIPIHRGNGLANVFAKLNSGQTVSFPARLRIQSRIVLQFGGAYYSTNSKSCKIHLSSPA